MTSEVIGSFNVNASDVTTDIDYVSTGSIQLSVDGETTQDEVINAMTSTLTELLDIHPRDVTIISVDLHSGSLAKLFTKLHQILTMTLLQSNISLMQWTSAILKISLKKRYQLYK